MAFVDEASADAAGTAVHVFIGAPDGEIATRIMQFERHISSAVRHIPADDAPLRTRSCGYARIIKKLTAVIIHAREHHKRDRGAFALDYAFYILGADCGFPKSRPKLN